ncbi:VanZ family protein [Clostridium fallax]|nr:VanZ family protein [Clostridium fallax]SQB06293.1 VanZ family protein [Clostridium fallax]
MKYKKLGILKNFIPSLIMMIIIFFMSSQSKEASLESSSSIINIFKNIFPFLENIIGDNIINFLVRKSAHIIEFLVLFLSLYYGFNKYFKDRNKLLKPIVYSSIITFLYSCTDEIHQKFILGRDGKFSDILVDFIGVIIGSLIIYLYRKGKEKNKKLIYKKYSY